MEAGRSLREVFAQLSRPDGGDPAALLRAAGFGDVPEHLVAEAIVSYAGTAPLEVAEHLAPFAVAHGPLPDPDADPVGVPHALSVLTAAPAADPPGVDPAHLDEPLDVDPSGLDDDLDPAAVDGLDADVPHAGVHHEVAAFGVGGEHDLDPGSLDGGLDDHVDPLLVHDHDQHFDVDDHGVSEPGVTEPTMLPDDDVTDDEPGDPPEAHDHG